MAIDMRWRIHHKGRPDLDLPPAFRLVALREKNRAFEHAQEIAAKEGAGTLVWVGRFDLVEFAVVLEPDEPLAAARRIIYAGMNALADTLAIHAPPETLISFEWPDALFVDGGLVGGGHIAWPKGCEENMRPDWLVFGAMLRTVILGNIEPGLKPHLTALEDAGFSGLEPGRLVETFSRHFLATINTWQQDGFASIAKSYLLRLPVTNGAQHLIDGDGNLRTRKKGSTEVNRRRLRRELANPSWFDPESGEIYL
jgi:biotin-(acetyl-CoA carboxylase) ligase